MLGRGLRGVSRIGSRMPARVASSSAPASGLAFPNGLDDAIFTGMTERDDTDVHLSASTTYERQSWLDEASGTWTVLMNDNVTCNYFRMRTKEGPRYRGYTNTAFNWSYIEVYDTDTLAHADGCQWEGGVNSVTFKNCHFRGLDGAFTCFFAADGSSGSFVFEDCLFTTDGGSTHHALVLYADTGPGDITVSIKNCYFQDAADWDYGDPFDFGVGNGATNPCDVVLWDNVRYCAWNHSTKVLTPGSLITQPSGT